MVSTSIGIEGLDAQDGRDYSRRGIAAAILDLVSNTALRDSLSRAARKLVKERFRFRVAAAAAAFERICLDTPARN